MKTIPLLSLVIGCLICAFQAQAARSDYVGQTYFPKGDSIEITSVNRTKDQMVVKGHYHLVSADSASLALYITSTNSAGADVQEGPKQSIHIAKGQGDFELVHPHLVPGLPHVSMYAGGKSFASLYFGTKVEAEAEGQMDLGYMVPAPTIDSAPPVVVKTVPLAGATDVDPALTEIKVTYSKAMQDGSWSWSTWGEENFPEIVGQPKYMADRRTCVLTVKLQPGKFYATWLNSDKFRNFKDAKGQPAVPYLLTFRTAETGVVVARTVNKLVSDFPATDDLSTPEGACAAWQRASAAKDAQAISKLSLVPLDAQEQKAWYQREEKRDPEGLAMYLKAVAESQIVAVQVYRSELANVVTYLPFPDGKGRSPYSSRSFGLVNGAWKNLGEDRLPDLESAWAGFAKKKDRLWQQFAELKKVTFTSGPMDPAVAEAEWLLNLNDDQRTILTWTDRQFRSFFDARTFDGWSADERANLEKRLIDALSGPRNREYYQAINSLAALRSTNALPKLREIAFDRADKDCRDRWMATRAIGIIGDKTAVPELVHLVYHGNPNTRWWAQISLVRLTRQNFSKDWNAWGNWWNEQNGQPPFKPEIIRWWSGQAADDKLAASLDESDQKFLADLK